MIECSAKTRQEELESSSGKAFDVLVTGGEIICASVANTPSQAGMLVILVAKGDFLHLELVQLIKVNPWRPDLIHGGLIFPPQGHLRLTRNLFKLTFRMNLEQYLRIFKRPERRPSPSDIRRLEHLPASTDLPASV